MGINVRSVIRITLVTLMALIPAAVLSAASSTSAHAGAPSSATYVYLIGSGAVCDFVPCPEKTSAPNGDILSLAGEGTFSVRPNSATGGGTFVHEDAEGNVVDQGTWTATDLVSFVDFGISPELEEILPEGATGGRAVLRVHVSVDGGPSFDTDVTVICDLGSNPPGQNEVARTRQFNKHFDGGNIFIKQ